MSSSSAVSLGRNLVSLKWEDFNVFVVSELAALYQKDDLTDVTLFCEGRSFRAHKVLLSLWSTYFRDVFRSTSHSHPVVILRETSSSDLELILRFIYQGHLLIPIEETDRFLKAAEHFQVAGLKNMRTHVPSFSYPPTSSPAPEGNPGSSSVQQPAGAGGASTSIPLQFAEEGHASAHASIYESQTSGMDSPPPPPNAHSQPPSGNIRSAGVGAVQQISSMPPPQQPPPPPASVAVVQGEPGHHFVESNQQQVIRQGSSSRVLQKSSSSYSSSSQQVVVAAAYPGGNQMSPSGSQVQVVTRVAPESVIFHQQNQSQSTSHHGPPQQQVVIFPPSSSSGGAQYITTRGGEGVRGQEMMVVQGIDGESVVSAVHIEQAPGHSTPSYTVYAHSSSSPVPNPHHSESSTDEAIMGLPYPPNSPTTHHPHHPHALHRESSIDVPHHHGHSHPHHTTAMELDGPPQSAPQSVVVTHSYPSSATSCSSSSYEIIQNGNASTSSSSAEPSPTSKVKPVPTEPPPVYAVKRIPPPIPPSPPPPAAVRNFKNPSTTTIKRTSSPKKSYPSPQSSASTPGASPTVATRSRADHPKSARKESPYQSTSSPTPPPGSGGATPGSAGTPSSGRKVVLVPCPKCGKKVKQTSLKVHMKRTHLEEGTVLVCPICAKRISSKGVYYKHMYIHRKRSEQADNNSRSSTGSASSSASITAASSTLIKTETQGT